MSITLYKLNNKTSVEYWFHSIVLYCHTLYVKRWDVMIPFFFCSTIHPSCKYAELNHYCSLNRVLPWEKIGDFFPVWIHNYYPPPKAERYRFGVVRSSVRPSVCRLSGCPSVRPAVKNLLELYFKDSVFCFFLFPVWIYIHYFTNTEYM